jgi:hypothetical protein
MKNGCTTLGVKKPTIFPSVVGNSLGSEKSRRLDDQLAPAPPDLKKHPTEKRCQAETLDTSCGAEKEGLRA